MVLWQDGEERKFVVYGGMTMLEDGSTHWFSDVWVLHIGEFGTAFEEVQW